VRHLAAADIIRNKLIIYLTGLIDSFIEAKGILLPERIILGTYGAGLIDVSPLSIPYRDARSLKILDEPLHEGHVRRLILQSLRCATKGT
jgi:hypothetical protein